MAEIRELGYRTADEIIDSVRIDLQAYQSQGEIDNANLLKVILRINYELGLRIHMQKETMLEVNHGRAALPADFHQMLLALSCHNYRHVQYSPSNGNVLLEEVCQTGAPAPSTCPCWTVVSPGDYKTTYIACTTGTVTPIAFTPGTTNICAQSIDSVHGSGTPITVSTSTFCYPGTNGVMSCSPPNTCDICNVQHPGGTCPELVINPYPLGKCRTICGGTDQQATIKILQYCSSEVFCYETFDRLFIIPNYAADGFSNMASPGTNSGVNTASIRGNFLEVNNPHCTKVYIQYLGAMENELGQLIVPDHGTILSYYSYALKERILENIYLNGGEDVLQRLRYTSEKREKYRIAALDIANQPNMRDVINTTQVLRANANRQYYATLSRYFGYLGWGGWASPVDNYGIR
jgi:hypothetical protein